MSMYLYSKSSDLWTKRNTRYIHYRVSNISEFDPDLDEIQCFLWIFKHIKTMNDRHELTPGCSKIGIA